MSKENESKSGGTNWLMGLDKLTTPTLDYFGIKIRDSLRVWLNEKARDRALLRRFEKEFLYRQIDLLNYGSDQFGAMLEKLSAVMLERQFQNVSMLVSHAVKECNLPSEKAFAAVMEVLETRSDKTKSDEANNLTSGEVVLKVAVLTVFDTMLTFQVVQMLFHYCQTGAAFHQLNPDVTDEKIESLMQDDKTMQAISDAMEAPMAEFAKFFAKSISEAYGHPFDEESFARAVSEAELGGEQKHDQKGK
jgi:hypothetical protein